VETGKTLVAKVVGNAKMHISTKNGTMVPKFAVELAQTMHYNKRKNSQANVCVGASQKILGDVNRKGVLLQLVPWS
jgi:hypothetical protein